MIQSLPNNETEVEVPTLQELIEAVRDNGLAEGPDSTTKSVDLYWKRAVALQELCHKLDKNIMLSVMDQRAILGTLAQAGMDSQPNIAWWGCMTLTLHFHRLTHCQQDALAALRLCLQYNQALPGWDFNVIDFWDSLHRIRKLAAHNEDCRQILTMLESGKFGNFMRSMALTVAEGGSLNRMFELLHSN